MAISNKLLKITYLVGGVVGLSLLLLYFFVEPSNTDLLPKCPILVTTGYYCSGCGSQRALHDLLHLDVLGVLQHNALFIPALLIIGYYCVIKFLEYRYKRNIKNFLYHPKTPIIIFIVIVVFTVLRNIDRYPFNLLEP